jgi:hypothetical protein
MDESPRVLVLNNIRRALETNKTENVAKNRESIPPVNPGEMRLYSFYAPSLQADTYTISVSQSVDYTDLKAGSHKAVPLELNAATKSTTQLQTFRVVAPQFKIEDKDIHSCYPPQGHADQPNVLPHIVLNDPHLPWARPIKESDGDELDMIPWLALFPFDCNGPDQELRLSEEQLNGPKAVYQKPNQTGAGDKLDQSSTFTISMSVKEYLDLPNQSSTTKIHIPPFSDQTKDPEWQKIKDDPTPVEVIFMSAKLFGQLFPVDPTKKFPDLKPFRFLSHVRNVNTSGMPSSGSGVEDTGIFSILHSKRTGPTGTKRYISTPTTRC